VVQRYVYLVIATEIDLEDVIEEFKVLIPGKRRIEL